MNRLHSVAFAVTLALVLATSALLPAAPVLANALGRDRDPLVLTGASLAGLVGTAPSRLAAFRWDGQWTQNPVQVDERTLVDFGAIYDTTATGVDVLDRHKSLFGPGNCARSENTFSAGEGAFMTNSSGPVRALRGYLGCNSGPTSWRMHAFYESREDCSTALRVHPIPGIMDYFDYSPAAAGMTYRNNLNLAGVTVDGSPDPGVVTGPLAWEMVSGGQDTLVMTSILVTDIQGLPLTSYYSDNVHPTVTQCIGDPWEYGASGLRVNGEIPNTDPAVGPAQVLEAWRVIVYAAPDQDAAFAVARQAEATHPLVTTAQPYVPTVAVAGLEPRGASLMLSPNPATGRARILLTLPRAGVTRLSVHDVSGRFVTIFAEGWRDAGQHAFDWDAGGVPPGLYLVRVSRDGRTEAVCRFARLR